MVADKLGKEFDKAVVSNRQTQEDRSRAEGVKLANELEERSFQKRKKAKERKFKEEERESKTLKGRVKGFFAEKRKQRAKEKAISDIAREKASVAGRAERFRLAEQVAVKKEQVIAQGELDQFRERRARKSSGGGGLGFNAITGSGGGGFSVVGGGQQSGFSVVGGARTRGFSVIDPVQSTRVVAPRTRRKIRKVKKRGKSTTRRRRRRTVARAPKQFKVI